MSNFFDDTPPGTMNLRRVPAEIVNSPVATAKRSQMATVTNMKVGDVIAARTLELDDVVLVMGQVNYPEQNGLYTVGAQNSTKITTASEYFVGALVRVEDSTEEDDHGNEAGLWFIQVAPATTPKYHQHTPASLALVADPFTDTAPEWRP